MVINQISSSTAIFCSYFLVYDDDNEHIPKNSSLVVRRMPAKSAATSLIARLKGNIRGGTTAATLVYYLLLFIWVSSVLTVIFNFLKIKYCFF
jgi:hypothetical protein